jgi:hypothetical protein
MIAAVLEFTVQFFLKGLVVSNTPAIGNSFSNSVGIVIFGFTYVVTVPSWCNEKRENVSVNRVIWLSTLFSCIIFLAVGILGAWAYSDLEYANLLTYMAQPDNPIITQISVYLFSFFVIGLGIPLFAIYIRLNLYVGGVCGGVWSTFWGAVFPWLFSWLLYEGEGFTNFENWAALIINGFINFVVPYIIFLTAKRAHRKYLLGATADPVPAAKPHPFERLFTKPIAPDFSASESDSDFDDEEELGAPLVRNIEEDEHHHRALPRAIERRIHFVTIPIILSTLITVAIIIAIIGNIWSAVHHDNDSSPY